MQSLLNHATFIAGAIAALAFLYLSFRIFGRRGLLPAIGALFILLTYRKGRTDGSQTHIEKERANADHAVREADEARADARVRDAGDSWVSDDGFRRD